MVMWVHTHTFLYMYVFFFFIFILYVPTLSFALHKFMLIHFWTDTAKINLMGNLFYSSNYRTKRDCREISETINPRTGMYGVYTHCIRDGANRGRRVCLCLPFSLVGQALRLPLRLWYHNNTTAKACVQFITRCAISFAYSLAHTHCLFIETFGWFLIDTMHLVCRIRCAAHKM